MTFPVALSNIRNYTVGLPSTFANEKLKVSHILDNKMYIQS